MTKLFKSRTFVRIIVVLLFACFLGAGMSLLFSNRERTTAEAALSGEGTKLKPWQINTIADLETFRNNVNGGNHYTDEYVVLNANLDLSSIDNFTPIGSFKVYNYFNNSNGNGAGAKRYFGFNGHFDGKNHTISNLTIGTGFNGTGLFGYCYNAEISNLTLINPSVSSSGKTSSYVGALVGCFYSDGTAKIENCHMQGGGVSGSYFVGGLVGIAYSYNDWGFEITNCTVKGYGPTYEPAGVWGTYYVGGIVGFSMGRIGYYYNTDYTESAGMWITKCASTASVHAYNGAAGGIIGQAVGTSVDQCYCTGAVITRNQGSAGGIIGSMSNFTPPHTGTTAPAVFYGIATPITSSKVSNCFVTGDVQAAGGYAGGIVGYVDVETGGGESGRCGVEKCLVTGNVLSASPHTAAANNIAHAGGIIGSTRDMDNKHPNQQRNVYVGRCAVASQRVYATGNGGTVFASPFANSFNGYSMPAMYYGTTNVYNKDMLISARYGGSYEYTNAIEGKAISMADFKAQKTYKDMGWGVDGKAIWRVNAQFNDGFPFLTAFGAGNLAVEYPYGSAKNPILIKNAEDMAWMQQCLSDGWDTFDGQYIKQTADIDMTDSWIMGYDFYSSFRGNYDGDQFKLKNIEWYPGQHQVGLFAYTVNASIKNVIVERPKISTGAYANHCGVIIGHDLGNLYMDNCAVIGGLVAADVMTNVGGMIGYARNAYITRCFSSAEVKGGSWTGGLIGGLDGAYISQCYATAKVSGTARNNGKNVFDNGSAGGLLGWFGNAMNSVMYDYDPTLKAEPTEQAYATVTDCYFSGEVSNWTRDNNSTGKTSYNQGCGGLIGYAQHGSLIKNCYTTGGVWIGRGGALATNKYYDNTNAGGIVGISVSAEVRVENCLSAVEWIVVDKSANPTFSHAGYFNTYGGNTTNTDSDAIPQTSKDCFYVKINVPEDEDPEDWFSSARGDFGGSINNGTETTVDDIKSGKVFTGTYTVSNEDGSTTSVNSLGWDMSNVWSINKDLNGGYPMLKGLIVDTTDLLEVIYGNGIRDHALQYGAKGYAKEDWSEETYSVLEKLVQKAEADLTGSMVLQGTVYVHVIPITYELKTSYVKAILEAIDNLKADTAALIELYNKVRKDMEPYKPYYVSFVLVDSLMPQAQVYIEDTETKWTNTEINSIYSALKLAVDNLRINKTELNKAIEEANAIMLNASSYSDAQVAKLDAALKNAVKVNNDDAVLAPAVNNATLQLKAALEEMQLDKAPLLNAIIDAYAYIGVEVKYDVPEFDDEKDIIIVNESNRISSVRLLHYADFETKLNTAIEVLKNKEATSQAITNALFDLNLTKNALALNKSKLQELTSQATAELINEKYYTAESVTALKTAKEVADGIINTVSTDTLVKQFSDFTTACDNLEKAIKGLAVNKTELLKVLNKAKSETQSAYSTETWQKLQDEKNKAQAVYDNANATKEEVSAAISALNDALQSLDITLDYLKDLIKQANYILDNESVKMLYQSGLDTLRMRKEEADELCKLPESNITVSAVKETTRALEAALNALKVDKTAMNHYIDMALTSFDPDYVIEDEYTPESYNAFKDLAQEAMNKRDSMSDNEVATYTLRLKAAYEDLVANKDELTKLVTKISEMSNKKYRQDNDGKWIVDEDTGNMKVFVIYESKSWSTLETELNKAKNFLSDKKTTPTQVKESVAALNAAVEGLVVDTSELKLRMEKALELLAQDDLYTYETRMTLQDAYDAAKQLLDDAEASGTKLQLADVQEKLDAILVAINGMEADTSAIYGLLSTVSSLLEQKDFFTKESGNNLQSKYDQVSSLVDKGAELDASSVALLAQMLTDAMKSIVISTDALQALVDRYEALKNYKNFISGFDDFADFVKVHRLLLKKNALAIKKPTDAVEQVSKYVDAYNDVYLAYRDLEPDWDAFGNFIAQAGGLRDLLEEPNESLNNAIDSAQELYDDRDNEDAKHTYDEVITKVNHLKAALKDLQKTELQKLIEKVNADMNKIADDIIFGEGSGEIFFGAGKKVGEVYSVASYKKLLAALAQGNAVLSMAHPEYDEIDNAMTAINDAVDNLIVDPAMLQALIDECEELYKSDYFDQDSQEWADFTDLLADSKDFVEATTTDLLAYYETYTDLLNAKNALVFLDNTLDDILDIARSKRDNDGSKCTSSSLAALSTLINSIENNKPSSGTDEYNKACSDLLDAIANLTYTDKLQAEIAKVKAFIEAGNPDSDGKYYSEGSWKELGELVNSAEALLTKADLRQYEVNSMVEQLQSIRDKETGVLLDVTAAKKFSDDQHKIIAEDKDKYTEETWTPYVAAVDNLDALIKLSKYEVTEKQIDDAIEAVNEAFALLEEDLNKTFILKESNKTFKFIYGPGNVVENYSEHKYDEEKPIYLGNIAVNDTVADIIAQFDNPEIKAFNAKGEEITDTTKQVVATGIVLRVMAGETVLDELTLVLTGDVNGDGKVNQLDGSQLNMYFKGTKKFDVTYLIAADINADGKVNQLDGSQLNMYFKGTKDLYKGLSVKGAA